MKRHLVLGGPGCGKTTRLLNIIKAELESGVSPSQIAFVAFTNAAADEAKQRAAEQFGLDPRRDLPWFRTIHSLAYGGLAIQRDEVMQRKDWVNFGNTIGEPMSGYISKEDLEAGDEKPGDKLLRVTDYSRNTLTSLSNAWQELGDGIDQYRLIRFAKALDQFKRETGKIDFTDMLLNYPSMCTAPALRVAVVDEAQDLTPAQWAVVQHAFGAVERLYVAGDDDQAIYRWAGADVNFFLNFPADREVLPISHRLPEKVHHLARKIALRISTRYDKPFVTTGRDGKIEHHYRLEGIDLAAPGSWLLIARNSYMLKEWERMAREQGLPYLTRKGGSSVNPEHVTAIVAWEDWRKGKPIDAASLRVMYRMLKRTHHAVNDARQYTAADMKIVPHSIWHEALVGIPLNQRTYYVSCLRRKEKLTQPPRIRIDTIHGVKGGEADNVAIMTDMSYRTHKGYATDPDTEHRVFYVGVTRARHNLHIVEAQTQRSYRIGA